MGGAHPVSTDREELGRELVEPSPSPSGAVATSDGPGGRGRALVPDDAAALRSARASAPMLVAILTLMLAGVLWAAIRGLHFYGLGPFDVLYDIDQPPLLLILVGGWLAYRSSRR